MNDILTTGDVAKLCRVAPRTVSKWMDTGLLKGWKIPPMVGRPDSDRRFNKKDVLKFMKDYGMDCLLSYPLETHK